EALYKNFYSLLFIHYKKERSIKFYADKLNITPKYFSKIVKETSNKNASDIIDEMIVMGTKAALKCTNQSVQQISEEFNFPNASFFGTFFKRKTGVTPLQYRNI
ncbi:helix-turn-helix domain-containing protein, partial [Chryseobacterium taichungense]|uniref:helix-turn-helix domain-containing protein n=1 Tax=Chryseobacterium taichungense TaxID=295069 RepID=UPI0028AF6B6C